MEPVSNPPNTAPRLKLVAQAELLAKLPAIDPPPVDCILSPAGRTGTVTFKPYDDVRPPKKRFAFHGSKADGGSRAVNVEDLYPEILCLIFSKLDVRSKGRAAQVCTVWRDSVYSKSVWRGCTARLHLNPISSTTMLPALLHRGLKRVQVLSVSTTQCLQVLLASLPALSALDLAGCVNLSDAVLETGFTMNLPALTSINLGLCKKVTDNSFGRIGTHCKNLMSLDLGGCTKISNTGLLLLVSLGLPALTHLNLRSCWQLTDAGISHLTNGPNSLPIATLILQDCQKLTDQSLRHISEGLPTLKSLNLSFCASITDSGMKCLARMASLKELNLRFCDNISDIGVSYLSQGSVGLQSLDLSFCDRVTDSAMAHIASGLFNLKSLSLAACRLQDDGVAKISKTLLDLERLSLGQCSRITDRSLVLVGDSMRKLGSLDVYGCTRITSGGLQGIRVSLPHTTINTDLWQ